MSESTLFSDAMSLRPVSDGVSGWMAAIDDTWTRRDDVESPIVALAREALTRKAGG